VSAHRRRRRRLIARQGEDDDPLSSLTNLFDVAMVFAVALMAALVGRFNMSDLLVAKRGERVGAANQLESGEIIHVPDE